MSGRRLACVGDAERGPGANEALAMFGVLPLVPVATSLILGIVYVAAGDASGARKLSVAAVVLVALYLQFLSRYGLAGMFLQVAVALGLIVWRKADAA